jgi:hypothetical protein
VAKKSDFPPIEKRTTHFILSSQPMVSKYTSFLYKLFYIDY